MAKTKYRLLAEGRYSVQRSARSLCLVDTSAVGSATVKAASTPRRLTAVTKFAARLELPVAICVMIGATPNAAVQTAHAGPRCQSSANAAPE